MRTPGWKLIVAGAVVLASAGVAIAQVDAGAVIKNRKEQMEVMTKAATKLRVNLNSDKPDLTSAKADAVLIRDILVKVPEMFPKGSGPSNAPPGVETHAQEAIFTQLAAFRYRANKTEDMATALIAEIDKGDSNLEKIRAAENAMRGGCGGCHETFRP